MPSAETVSTLRKIGSVVSQRRREEREARDGRVREEDRCRSEGGYGVWLATGDAWRRVVWRVRVVVRCRRERSGRGENMACCVEV